MFDPKSHTASQRVPDLLLERLALGELAPAQAASVRERLAAEPGGTERLEALQGSNTAILTQYPPRQVAAAIAERARHAAPKRPNLQVWLQTLVPAVAVAALAFVVLRQPEPASVPQETAAASPVDPAAVPDLSGGQERAKGLAAFLRIYRKGNAGPEVVAAGGAVRPGDQLQVAYVAAGQKYGVIVSWDGAGAVTLHSPTEPGQAAVLEPREEQRLPESYVLDNAPGFERFALVTADQPIVVDTVLAAARQLAADPARRQSDPLVLPAGMQQFSLLLHKR